MIHASFLVRIRGYEYNPYVKESCEQLIQSIFILSLLTQSMSPNRCDVSSPSLKQLSSSELFALNTSEDLLLTFKAAVIHRGVAQHVLLSRSQA